MPMPTAKIEEDSDFEATPSPPPKKKRKTTSAAKKGKKKMTAMEISHYYSSTFEEQTPSPQVQVQKKTWEKEVSSNDEHSDIAITKEIQSSAARTVRQMAQAAKQRPGLRRTS